MEYYFNFFLDSDILHIPLKFPIKHVWTVTRTFTCVFNVFGITNDVTPSKTECLWDS